MHAYAIALFAASAAAMAPSASTATGVAASDVALASAASAPDFDTEKDSSAAAPDTTMAPYAPAAVVTVNETTLMTVTSCAPDVADCPASIANENKYANSKQYKTITIAAPCGEEPESVETTTMPVPTPASIETETDSLWNTTTPTGMPVVAGASAQPVRIAALIGGISLAVAMSL